VARKIGAANEDLASPVAREKARSNSVPVDELE
jgi:hypothetical protein